VSASEGTSREDLHNGCGAIRQSTVTTHGYQSGVDKVVEDEMTMLATRLCWKKAKR
jgi:hypothetical protein